MLPAGHVIAVDQFKLPYEKPMESTHALSLPELKVSSRGDTVKINGSNFKVRFLKSSGTLLSYTLHDNNLIHSTLEPTFWRPPIDNDFGWDMPGKCNIWKQASFNYKLIESKIQWICPGQANFILNYELPNSAGTFDLIYHVLGTGDIIISSSFKPGSPGLPLMPKLGVRFQIPKEFNSVEYYGLGPHENYIDRNSGSMVGVYSMGVEDFYFLYPSPQENGNRTDVRWMSLRNQDGQGLLIVGLPMMEASVSEYSIKELTREKRGSLHVNDVKKEDGICVNVDYKQMGVGGDNSWGARPHSKYLIESREYSFQFRLCPLEMDHDAALLSNHEYILR